jgi:hypothetical protein
MNTKKIVTVLLIAFCVAFVTPALAKDASPIKTEIPKEIRAQQIEHRLIEIRNMDRSSLSRAEKKELRKEVKSLKKEAATQGVYLSIGAIIIIILLLILLL